MTFTITIEKEDNNKKDKDHTALKKITDNNYEDSWQQLKLKRKKS